MSPVCFSALEDRDSTVTLLSFSATSSAPSPAQSPASLWVRRDAALGVQSFCSVTFKERSFPL